MYGADFTSFRMQRAVRGAGGGRGGPRPGALVRPVAEAAKAKAKAPGLGFYAQAATDVDGQRLAFEAFRGRVVFGGVAAAAAGLLLGGGPAAAELNRLEYERGGEFNRGTAMQFGGTDMIKVDIAKQYGNDLRLSNFVQGEWLRAARCIRRTGRRADATA